MPTFLIAAMKDPKTGNLDRIQVIKGWVDASGNPQEKVLEIPTPRWTAHDAAYFKVKIDPKVPLVTQERAFTSPIWYSPR